VNSDEWGSVILAGGFGTRIKHLHPNVPKPMIETCGKPFMEWVILYLAAQGIRDFSISTGYKAEIIEEYLAKRFDDGLFITSVREDEPLGTAGGFLMAAKALSSRKLLIAANGDSLVLADLQPAIQLMEAGEADAVMIGCRVPDCSRYGSLKIGPDGFLSEFGEKRLGEGIINAGIYLLSSKTVLIFPGQRPLSFEYDVFPLILSRGLKVKVAVTDEPFIDMGTPETVTMADAFIRKHMDRFGDVKSFMKKRGANMKPQRAQRKYEI
jgi:D-glycero-alpha-D-manno-heptose 1-phosphate guanylyltransferase